MSCYRLKTYDATPPGAFPYEQTDGLRRKFKSQPLIEAQAQAVASFRAANHLPRASVKEALLDIDHYTCGRLGNMPQYCIDCEAESVPVTALGSTSPIITPCAGCGAPIAA